MLLTPAELDNVHVKVRASTAYPHPVCIPVTTTTFKASILQLNRRESLNTLLHCLHWNTSAGGLV